MKKPRNIPGFLLFACFFDESRDSRLSAGSGVWLDRSSLCGLVDLLVCLRKEFHRLRLIACGYELLEFLYDSRYLLFVPYVEDALAFRCPEGLFC